jgi:hypothetical protein
VNEISKRAFLLLAAASGVSAFCPLPVTAKPATWLSAWRVEIGAHVPDWALASPGAWAWDLAEGLSLPGVVEGDLDWGRNGIEARTPGGVKHARIGDWLLYDGQNFDVRHAEDEYLPLPKNNP